MATGWRRVQRTYFMTAIQIQATFLVPVILENPPEDWFSKTVALSNAAREKLLRHTDPYKKWLISDFHIVKEEQE